jgi:carbonic anhydrase
MWQLAAAQGVFPSVLCTVIGRLRSAPKTATFGSVDQPPGTRPSMSIVEITYRYDTGETSDRPRPADAAAARDRLDAGSRTIAALLDDLTEGTGTARRIIPVDPRDLGLARGDQRAPSQRPYAAVLGCSDARVPIELIFNEGPNDLFVVRVAGNGLGSEVLGSLKYAVDHLGESVKLVVVLGHSGCGAVSAAVDLFLNPQAYLSLADKHSLRNILDRLVVVVHAAAKKMTAVLGQEVTRRPGYREALIEATIVSNAALAARTLQWEIGNADLHGLRAAYGVYLLSERRVWAPRHGSAECGGLAYPPQDAADFDEFADAVVRSDRFASLL